MDDNIYESLKNKGTMNPFINYLEFLKDNGELLKEEETLYNSRGRGFIYMIEKTSMSKTYKMPLLLDFYNGVDAKLNVTEDDVHKEFRDFYSDGLKK